MAKKKISKQKQRAFLEYLGERGNVSYAARQAGFSRSRAYELKKEDEEFAALWREAVDESDDLLMSEAMRRAVEGVEEPYFYQGEQRGTVRKYSDTMLMFLLKTQNPEKFGSGGKDTPDEGDGKVVIELHLAGEEEAHTA